jgi:hypothetical protein
MKLEQWNQNDIGSNSLTKNGRLLIQVSGPWMTGVVWVLGVLFCYNMWYSLYVAACKAGVMEWDNFFYEHNISQLFEVLFSLGKPLSIIMQLNNDIILHLYWRKWNQSQNISTLTFKFNDVDSLSVVDRIPQCWWALCIILEMAFVYVVWQLNIPLTGISLHFLAGEISTLCPENREESHYVQCYYNHTLEKTGIDFDQLLGGQNHHMRPLTRHW